MRRLIGPVSAIVVAAGIAWAQPHSVPGFTITDYFLTSASQQEGAPVEMTFGAGGELYVGHDRGGFGGDSDDPARIYRVDPGGGTGALYGNSAIVDADAVLYDGAGVYGPAGSVLVAGISGAVANSGEVRIIAPDQTVSALFGPIAGLENPNGISFDANNDLIVADNDGEVWKITTGGVASILFDNGPDGGGATLNLAGDRIYTRFMDTIQIRDLNGALIDGSFVTGRTLGVLEFAPGNAIWGDDLYGVDRTNGNFVRIDEFGNVTDIGTNFGTGPLGDGRLPADFAFAADGGLLHSIPNEARIIRIIPEPASAGLLLLGAAFVARRRS